MNFPFDFGYQKPRLVGSIVGQSFRADPDTFYSGKLQLTKQASAAFMGHSASETKEGSRKQTMKAVDLSAGRLPCPTAGHQLCRDGQAISAYSLTSGAWCRALPLTPLGACFPNLIHFSIGPYSAWNQGHVSGSPIS